MSTKTYIKPYLWAVLLLGLATQGCSSLSLPGPSLGTASLTASSPKTERVLNTATIQPEIRVPRSMWIWKTHLALEPAEGDRLLEFCKLRHIERLFLYTGKKEYFTNPRLRNQLATFITKAHAQNIAIDALDGWPEAIFPEFHYQFLGSLQRVLDYNQSAPVEARFAGFQSDIEPKGLPGYYNDTAARQKYDGLFLQIHEKCKVAIDESSEENFVFGIALSARYDESPQDHRITWQGKEGWVSDHMIQIVDYFAMMSYSDSGQSTIQMAEYEIALGNQWNKPVWVGAETLDVFSMNIGPKSITFAEEGLDYMEEELAVISRRFKDEKSFAGLAIHCYEPYRYLQSSPAWNANFIVASAQPLPANSMVDGDLEEWSAQHTLTIDNAEQLTYNANAWQGPEDLSAQIHIGWTPETLRIAVSVYDNKLLQFKPNEGMWEGDHIEVWLYAPNLDRIYQFGFTPGDFRDMQPHSWLWYPKKLSPALRSAIIDQLSVAATQPHAHGYKLECAIPADVIGVEALTAEMELRVSIEVGDADDPKKPHESLLSIAPAFNKNRPSSFALIKLKGE